jgi:membrane protease YdiL (CAAX protease family)
MRGLRISRIGLFLLLTFALSWGFDGLLTITVGHSAYLDQGLSPLGMFFPAFVAIVLRLFVFTDSPTHFRTYQGKPRWIFYGFLLLTVVYSIMALVGLSVQGQSAVFRGVGNLLLTLWTLLVISIAGQSSKAELDGTGLQLGDVDRGVKFILGVIVFFAVQAGLNLLLGLGEFQGQVEQIYGISISAGIRPLALIVAFGLAITGIPLSGLALTFGEEYGWRGLLQDELSPVGKRWTALIVGLIWGLWHFPIIMSGVHTYPSTILGLGLGLVFFMLWGVVQSYAVYKTGSIWVAAFLHGVVNSVYAFMLDYIVRPDDMLFSFGLGVYGLVCLALVVLFLTRDPIWKPLKGHS